MAEYKDRGSRFIAMAYPLSSVDSFKQILETVKKEHPKAVHHCFAYRIGTTGNVYRSNDDGEPSGSAGKPILGQIDSKKLTDTATIPSKGSTGAAGYDLYAIESHTLAPGERKAFKTGISLAIPYGVYGRVAPRSGLAVKHGIDVLAGVIDSDYRGEILVALINLGSDPITLPIVKDGKETAIAQIIFESYTNYDFNETDNLDSTERGSGGFGSSDTKNEMSSTTKGKSLEELLRQKESETVVVQKYSDAIRERDNKLFNK